MYVCINIWRLVHRCSRGRTSPPNSRCQFTCFACNFTCFTGANVQMLTAERGACLCQGKCERWEQVNDMNTVALSNAKAEMLLLSKDRKAAEDKLARYEDLLEAHGIPLIPEEEREDDFSSDEMGDDALAQVSVFVLLYQ